MKRVEKLQKVILWLMIILTLTTNFDFSIFAQESAASQSQDENVQVENTDKKERTGRIYEDTNLNGVRDEGEPGIAGICIKAVLPDHSDIVAEAVSDADGWYTLSDLTEDSYDVMFYADAEVTAPYNLNKSAAAATEQVSFPEEEDKWILRYQNVKSSDDAELLLGLQKDDVEQIDKEIENSKKQLTSTESAYAADAKGKVSVWMDYLRYKDNNITANYKKGNKMHSNKDYIWIYLVGSSQALYCLQPGVTLLSGDVLDAGKGSLTNLFNHDTAVFLQRVAYYGCDYKGWGNLSSDEKSLYFMAAQSLIWENRGATDISWNMQNNKKTKINISSYRKKILAKVKNHEEKASFAGSTQTVIRNANNPNKEFIFSDSKSILSESTITDKTAGIKSAVISGNNLKIVLKNTDKYDGTTQVIKFQKTFPSSFGNQYFTSPIGRQTVFYFGNPTPREYTFSIKIQAKGNLRIKKVDDTGTPVANVSFKYGTSKTQLNSITAKTNSAGVADLNDIAAGTTIYIQEYEVPSNLVKSNEIKSAKIKASQTVVVDFKNERVRKPVTLRKLNAETGKPVANAIFSYTDGGTTYQGITNANGEFKSAITYPVGTKITMTEVSPGPGYLMPAASVRTQTKVLGLNDTDNIFLFKNTTIKVSLSVLKYNSRTKHPVSGMVFKVGPNLNGTQGTASGYDLLTTNASGKITSRNYDARTTIYYQEVDGPANIKVDSTIKSISFLDESRTVSVYNEETPVALRVIKTGEDQIPLRDVSFDIEEYSEASGSWRKKEAVKTNSDGIADSKLEYSREVIAKGYVRLVETNEIKGYKKLNEPVLVDTKLANIEKSRLDIAVSNEKIPTKFIVYKYDSDTKKPLANAEFEITDSSGNLVRKLVTNSKGEAATEDLYADTAYYLEETAVPTGYKKIWSGRKSFSITRNAQNTYEVRMEIPNDPIYGYIEVHKTDKQNRPLKGIEFTVYKNNLAVSTLITDSNGYAKSEKLLADAPYTVKETYAPKQYVTLVSDTLYVNFLNPPQITASGTGYTASFDKATMTMTYQIENEEKTGTVTVTKVDAEDSSIKVKGAKFQLYNYLSGQLIKEAVTDENGIATFTDIPIINPIIASNQGYYMLEEVTPGEHHVLPSSTKKYFSLSNEALHFAVTFKNPPIKGSVEIIKVDAEDTDQVLKDAGFALYKADDLSTVVTSGNTGTDGKLVFDDLRYGDYVLKETKASKYHYNDLVNGGNSTYYDKSIQGYRFTISKDKEVISMTVKNPKLKAQIKVIKKDNVGHYLKGAKFNIISSSGELLDTVTTDVNGQALSNVLDAEKIGDNGYVVEAEKLIGYEENKAHYPITFSKANTTQIEMITKTIINTPEVPSLKIHKTNEDGKPVKARFKLEGNIQYQNPIIEYFDTTSDNPTAELDDYVNKVINKMTDSFATIMITEISTESPYILDTQQYSFSLTYYNQQYSITPIGEDLWQDNNSFDESSLTLSLVNKKIPIKLQLIKQSSESNKYLADAEFKITPENLDPITVKTVATADGISVDLPYAESYTVEEVKAPEGYFNNFGTVTYKLSDFTATTKDGVVTAYNKTVKAINSKSPVLKIRKVGSDGKPLDAEFQISNTLGKVQNAKTSKQNDGYTTVDLSPFYAAVSSDYGTLNIDEIKVDGNYTLYPYTIAGTYEIYYGSMKLDFSGSANSAVQIAQSADNQTVTITITDQRKDFDFNMQKKGVGTDKPSASITMTAYKKGSSSIAKQLSCSINATALTSVKTFFTALNDAGGYDVYITETAASDGYKQLPKFKAFSYFPDNEGTDKFQDVDSHITLSQNANTFQLSLQNERLYGLRILKKDTQDNVANAVFKLTATSNAGETLEKEITTTNGEADVSSFMQELKDKDSESTWLIKIKETAADAGLQIFSYNVAELEYQPAMLGIDSSKFLKQVYSADQSLITLRTDKDNLYSADLTVKNKTIPVNFMLIKKDGKTAGKYLSGAEFEIKPEGKAAITVVTNGTSAGNTVQLPYAQSYTVRETKAPEGYILDAAIREYTIDEFQKTMNGTTITAYNMTQTYANDPYMGVFEIIKYDASHPKLPAKNLNGARFEIYEGTLPEGLTPEEQYDKVTTDNGYVLADTVTIGETKDGIGTSKQLPYGKYILKEVQAPSDYKLSKKLLQKEIAANDVTVHINFANELMEGTLQIYKYAGTLGAPDEQPLAGAEFTIHRTDTDEQIGDVITTNVTGDTGSITLPYGSYYAKEVRFPAGYVSTQGKQHAFTINSSHTTERIQIQNTKADYSFQLYKVDADTGTRLANATFGLFADGESPSQKDEPLLIFETNSNGAATVMLDTAGDYDIYELEAPKGYDLLADKFEIHVDDDQQTAGITVKNQRKSMTVTIIKQDESTGERLRGAVFEIRNTETGEIAATAGPTDADGKAGAVLPAGDGSYIVREITPPDGYVLNDSKFPLIINRDEQDDGTWTYTVQPVTVSNRPVNGNIRLIKSDEGDAQIRLADAVFAVYNSGGKEVDRITTNSAGEAMTKELSSGTYTLKEIQAPDGYELDAEKSYEAVLSSSQKLVTITAVNKKQKGDISVVKLDGLNQSRVLKDAEFQIFRSYEDALNLKDSLQTVISDDDGVATFTGLNYTDYYVRETKAPEGYEQSDYIQVVTVNKDSAAAAPVEYLNYPLPATALFSVTKRDADTREALQGAQFLVEGPDNYHKVYETDEAGRFQSEELAFGEYTVTEIKAPEGYRLSDPIQQNITLNVDSMEHPVTLEFMNRAIQSSIRIQKQDNSEPAKPLMNAVFDIYKLNEDGSRIEPAVDRLVTDVQGEAVSSTLKEGKYEVVEVLAPKGYEFTSETSSYFFAVDQDSEEEQELIVKNTAITGSLEIIKTDADTGSAVSGAQFTIYRNDDSVFDTITTDAAGHASLSQIPYGMYIIKETGIPYGYEQNAYQGTFLIGAEEEQRAVTLHVTNQQVKGNISLYKVDAEKTDIGVPGARYGIYTKLKVLADGSTDVDPDSYLGESFDLITQPDIQVPEETDPQSGEVIPAHVQNQAALSQNLPMGTYYVKELESPSNYKLNTEIYPCRLTVEEGAVEIIAMDQQITGSVSIHKTDAQTKKPLQGAVFALYTQANYDKLLEHGGSLEEIDAVYMTTDKDGNASADNLKLEESYVLIEHKAPQGYQTDSSILERFTPDKDVQAFTFSFTKTAISQILVKKINDEGYPLEGVLFGIFSYGPDHTAGTADDEQIDTFSTGYDGQGIAVYESTALENGWYYIKEVKEPDMGYELSNEMKTFEITDTKRTYEFTYVNHAAKGDVEIWKIDELGNALYGAQFALYKAGDSWFTEEDIENTDVFVQTFEMDEDAHAILKNLDVDCYVIKETKTPDGYKKAEDIFFDLNNGDLQTIDGRKHYTYSVKIENQRIKGIIEVQKQLHKLVDENAEISLRNAVFQILDESGTVVDTLISDDTGRAASKELPKGVYTIREIQAPDGTVLNTKSETISIDGSEEDDVYACSYFNDQITGQIRIIKVNEEKQPLLGAEFDVLDESGTIVDHIITDAKGKAVSKKLAYGWYSIRETKAPDGYSIDPDMTWKVFLRENEQTEELEILNTKTASNGVQVIKYDKDRPSLRLSGAVFGLYEKDAMDILLRTYTTGENGSFHIEALDAGSYVLKEISAPLGYEKDETLHEFTIHADTNIAYYISNEKPKGQIIFKKTGKMLNRMEEDSSYPNLRQLIWQEGNLENAEISIYANEEIYLDGTAYQKGDFIQTLQSGQTSGKLPAGRYTYRETKTPSSYILNSELHEITVKANSEQEAAPALAALKNTHGSVQLDLYKCFEGSDDTNLYQHVVFGVYTAGEITENSVIIPQDTLLAVFGIDEKGRSRWQKQQLPEGRYYVKELETADGYVLDTNKYPFTVAYRNQDAAVQISTQDEPVVNRKLYGTIRLKKTGNQFSGVQVHSDQGTQLNNPVYTIENLQGAEVEIRTEQDITIGATVYRKGDVVDTLISGKKEESRRLPLGTYTAKETKTPAGYEKNDMEYTITLSQNDHDAHASVWKELSIYNQKSEVEISVFKKFFNMDNSDLYKDVTFGIYAAEEIQGATSAAVLHKDDLIDILQIGADGSGVVRRMLPVGTYYIKERTTAEGYVLDEKSYPFTVEPDSSGQIDIPQITAQHPVMNYPDGSLTPFAFQKVDEEGNPLKNAVFKLYICNKQHTHDELAQDSTADCWKEVDGLSPVTSSENGIVDFGLLPDGDYQLQETEAPSGYVKPSGQWFIHVEKGIHIESRGAQQPPAFVKADAQEYSYQLKNHRIKELPILGGQGIYLYMGGGYLLILAAWQLMKIRKDEKNEETK